LAELDVERIAAAALQVSDELGEAGCTMRAVADRLGVTPMALYHHVDDKSALVALMVDRAIREQPAMPASTGDWKEDMWAMARWMRVSTHLHPALTHLRREHHVWTPTMLPMTERWATLWQQSGLSFEDGVLAAAVSSAAIVGAVETEVFANRMDRPSVEELKFFPSARQMMTTRVDPDVAFEVLVRSIIDGVYARLSAESRAAPAAH
jgi:AcrR family transcriptional regulator